ncbi:MAG TPA: lyase family protein, partial [bacterium]|nr:lyase family protein [bacterium]
MKLWQHTHTGAESQQAIVMAVEKFTAGKDPVLDLTLLPYDCLASKAHARMLAKVGLLSQAEAADLTAGLDAILSQHARGEFLIRPEDEDGHTAIENYLVQHYGEAGKKIHTGRSRNDQVLTALRLYSRDQAEAGIATLRKLPARSGLAVVGSWTAADEGGKPLRLGLLTSGLFVPAEDLEAAKASEFQGVELPEGLDSLPVAFVVKQGVRTFSPTRESKTWKEGAPLTYHQSLRLTGRYRTSGSVQYWAVDDTTWVRHRDVTVVRRRSEFPDFATGDQRWIDVSIVTGTAVLYEGRKPVFATLVSVGRDRLGDPKTTASTAQGDFEVVSKHVTGAG